MMAVKSINPYQPPANADSSTELPLRDDRSAHWIGNSIAFYLLGFTYFMLLQCACPAVHPVQLPGLIVPFAWSTFTILSARTIGEGVVAGVNGVLMGGLTLLFLIPFVMRFSVL